LEHTEHSRPDLSRWLPRTIQPSLVGLYHRRQ
jgi:hypothetical protein